MDKQQEKDKHSKRRKRNLIARSLENDKFRQKVIENEYKRIKIDIRNINNDDYSV